MDLFKHRQLTPELLAEVKRLHLQTRRLADEGFAGRYRSAFRGRGIEFEEVREYVPGDDVRLIDWKVTARSRKPYIKSFREERELSVMIAVDVSASTSTATRGELRAKLLARVGAVLALAAVSNNDKVGLVSYSDALETYHPPRKARGAVWRILHEVLAAREYGGQTDLAGLFRFLSRILKRRAVVFVLSDFIAADYELELATLAKRHDCIAIIAVDPADAELPRSGLVRIADPETGEPFVLDCRDEAARSAYAAFSQQALAEREQVLRRYGIDALTLKVNEPFMPRIKSFFDKRRRVAPR